MADSSAASPPYAPTAAASEGVSRSGVGTAAGRRLPATLISAPHRIPASPAPNAASGISPATASPYWAALIVTATSSTAGQRRPWPRMRAAASPVARHATPNSAAAVAASRPSSTSTRPVSVWKITPMSPKVTDHACPTATAATAATGGTPRPTSIGATMATGRPNPASPSSIPLKAHATTISSRPRSRIRASSAVARARMPFAPSTMWYRYRAGHSTASTKADSSSPLSWDTHHTSNVRPNAAQPTASPISQPAGPAFCPPQPHPTISASTARIGSAAAR